MERLTHKLQGNCGFVWALQTPGPSVQTAIDRLAAYEDTGLEPEEIVGLISPPNPPLTLEELREMNGEPVYIIGRNISQYDVYCGYAINGVEQFYKAALPSDSYGKTWLASRRKPEEGTA